MTEANGTVVYSCSAVRVASTRQRVQTVRRRYAPCLQQRLEGQQRQLGLRELQEEEAA